MKALWGNFNHDLSQGPCRVVSFPLFFNENSPQLSWFTGSQYGPNLCWLYCQLNWPLPSIGQVVGISIIQTLFNWLRIWPSVYLSALTLETDSPYSICICSIQFPFGNSLTQCLPICHNHQIIDLVFIKRQIMEKENKSQSQLCLARTLQCNAWLVCGFGNKKGKRGRKYSLCNIYLCGCFCEFSTRVLCLGDQLSIHTYGQSFIPNNPEHYCKWHSWEQLWCPLLLCRMITVHCAQPPGREHGIQLTLTPHHCKWTTVNTFMIAAQ